MKSENEDDSLEDIESAQSQPPPEVPPAPQLPEVPQLQKAEKPSWQLSRPSRKSGGRLFGFSTDSPDSATRTYSKVVMAATVATSLIGPMIVFALVGFWLDGKLHHQVAYLAGIGCIVGFFAGLVSVMDILRRLKK
ncbi:AtpZ/AtpI family protein [Chthonomonas calidirosea]|uniref:Putative F0F1-ATPase subunit (ATPase_gene1) n=1 Tax=Chthonomonas calidirosea (strain DSM 23976 / ICMP 18418 / T49) TaxID=1303518 RepID=S0ESU2_CHTCT|nr:AtpZ/AtpI family protein [Chthonomonas calidirosea]CCW34344.1 Putative F0F1-ATPase subunit (ATPase_gene1) [Chthonomonas calidirosea T49]CEK13857.1 Putative F0F1-ATPase subunit (ATPase_gene1) [Chthonomonas calidirosea]CEK15043.1 Putative F0F1-ATPase subunit (ATPase_gene1) [Chthonomonas calidirosea]